jgi:hypothetical protein
MKSAQWFLAAFILSCSLFVTGHAVASAAEPAPSAAKAPSTSPEAKQEGEKTEFYVGVYLQGSRPLNRPVRLQEDPFTNTDVQGGLGGGLKSRDFSGVRRPVRRIGGGPVRTRWQGQCAFGHDRRCDEEREFPSPVHQRHGECIAALPRRDDSTVYRHRCRGVRRVCAGFKSPAQHHRHGA